MGSKVKSLLNKHSKPKYGKIAGWWGEVDLNARKRWANRSDRAWLTKGLKFTRRFNRVKNKSEEEIKQTATDWYWKEILKDGKEFDTQYDAYSMGHIVSGIEGVGHNPIVAGKRIAKERVIRAIKRGSGKTVSQFMKHGISDEDILRNTPEFRRVTQELKIAKPIKAGYRVPQYEKDIIRIAQELQQW